MPSPLESILNFRDVGSFVNKKKGNENLKTGLFYRGARPDEASTHDRQKLSNTYAIKSVIDLRTKTEHIEQAQRRDAKIKASAALSGTNNMTAEPLKIPGLVYHEINFNGSAFSRMLISKLSWSELFRLAALMLFGYRLDAIKIISPHMEEMGLVGLATNSLDACTREVKQVFDVLSDENNWPVLVHCTQGKDRTGLVVMLVLLLLGVDQSIIKDDYQISQEELESEMEERIKEIGSIGLSEKFAVCDPKVVDVVASHIQEKYGGIEKYLHKTGVSKDQMAFVKGKLSSTIS